jgi:hypothetical protein
MRRSLAHGVVAGMLALFLAGTAHAQVHVDIGIHLPGPPQLVVVPEVRTVQYVPAASANLFFYGGQYWAYANGGWHVSRGYNGPWIVVGPQFVPRPILLVPVNYYRVPPGHWNQWARNHPPHWGHEWGHEWAERRAWRDHGEEEREEHGKGRARGYAKGHGG